MKITDLIESRDENDNLAETPPPGKTGNLITSAQAAVILGVSQSRVRQYVGDGRLKPQASPVKGQRDHFFKRADVEALAKTERKITGRPEGS